MFEVYISKIKYFIKQKARKNLSKKINDGFPRYSLVRLIIGLTTFIVSISAFVGFQFIHEFTLNNLKQTALLTVKNGVNEIDEWLSIRSSEIETIAATDIVRLLNWSISAPYLKSEVERIREFDWLAVATPDGWRHSTATGNERKNVKDRDFFKKAMAGQVNISDPLISRATNKTAIVVAAPIWSNSKKTSLPIGEIHSNVSLTKISSVISKLQYGSNSYAFVLNSKGQIIIHPNSNLISTVEKPTPSLLVSTSPNIAAIARRMVNQEKKIERVFIDGAEKYIAYLPLRSVNWSIGLVIPLVNIESRLWLLYFIGALVASLAVIMIIVLWQVDILEKNQLNKSRTILKQQAIELEKTLEELKYTQSQMIQNEKMSSLGQMVAGIAHEINNPVNFIHGNLNHLNNYTQDLSSIIRAYQQYFPTPPKQIQELIDEIDISFIQEDLSKIIDSMSIGTKRIREIVLSLRNFSRLDEAEVKQADIHEGIDSTLMILNHRLKAKPNRAEIQVIKVYSQLPLVNCYAGQLNQVFMNILSNAIDALEEKVSENPTISIYTSIIQTNNILITIADNGIGIHENLRNKLFDPFFTTKEVGKGTGLGLSISYQIVVEKHGGKLWCDSAPGKGTKFMIQIPI
jgi:two-component system, NtrC family, sensor kinase